MTSFKRLFNFTESETLFSRLSVCLSAPPFSYFMISVLSRLLSEGPRLSSAVVQPPSGVVPEPTKPAEVSQPPPYTHHTYHNAPPGSGVMATPPQPSVYAATSSDYSSLQHQQQAAVPVAHHGPGGALPPPPSHPSMTATLSSSPGSWSHNQPTAMGQLPSLNAYSANPLQQQRYVVVGFV